MSDTTNGLELITTSDLLKELSLRFEQSVFIGVKQSKRVEDNADTFLMLRSGH